MQGLVGGLCAAWGAVGGQLQLLFSFLVALAKAAAPWSKVSGSPWALEALTLTGVSILAGVELGRQCGLD
eukprot:scaffold101540_cov20-Tisochrysis_lutea.AAC.3